MEKSLAWALFEVAGIAVREVLDRPAGGWSGISAIGAVTVRPDGPWGYAVEWDATEVTEALKGPASATPRPNSRPGRFFAPDWKSCVLWTMELGERIRDVEASRLRAANDE